MEGYIWLDKVGEHLRIVLLLSIITMGLKTYMMRTATPPPSSGENIFSQAFYHMSIPESQRWPETRVCTKPARLSNHPICFSFSGGATYHHSLSRGAGNGKFGENGGGVGEGKYVD